MDPGTPVVDVDDEDPDVAIVLARPDATIAEYGETLSEGRTVADDNPDYDESEDVVVVAFVESGLDEHWPNWRNADPDGLYGGAEQRSIKLYAFPASRLEPIDEGEATRRLAEEGPQLKMNQLEARLSDAGWDTERDDGTLTVSKMGETYRIHPTGAVEGEGNIREPLENIVRQYEQ